MHLSLGRRLAVGAAVVVAFGCTGTAFACDGGGGRDAAAPPDATAGLALYRQHGRLRLHRQVAGLLPVVTSYLGIPRAQVAAQLRSGKTLAQIADATAGKSAAGLVGAIVESVRTKLDAAVASGRLTPAEEQRLLARLTTRVKFLVAGFPMIPMKPALRR